jgi:hypothetical protein
MYWRSNEAKEKFVRTWKTREGEKKKIADTKEKFVRTCGGGRHAKKKWWGRGQTRANEKKRTHMGTKEVDTQRTEKKEEKEKRRHAKKKKIDTQR